MCWQGETNFQVSISTPSVDSDLKSTSSQRPIPSDCSDHQVSIQLENPPPIDPPPVDRAWELHRQRNALLPSSRLPPELWGEIMYLYRDMCSDLVDSKTLSRPSLSPFSWIAVAQVCHQWRQMALDLPVLWTRIIHRKTNKSRETNAVMFAEMLTRSRDCPMTFVYRDTSVGVPTIGLIVQHIHRFRRISIELREAMWPFPSPTESEPSSIPFDTCPPPPILPDGNIPKIQELEIHRVAFMLYSPFLCRTMTKISLAKCRMKTLDCAVFLSSLQEMPGLLSLALEFIEITDLELHNPSGQMPKVIQLRNLQSFRIAMDGDTSMIAVLARLRVPHNARMSFRFESRLEAYSLTPSRGGECIRALDDFLASNLIGKMAPFRIAFLGNHDSGVVALWHSEPDSKWPHYLSPDRVDRDPDLVVSMSISTSQVTGSLQILCNHLPLSEVRSVYVSAHSVSRSSLWHGFFRRMKEARSVHLSMYRTIDVVYFLRALTKRSPMCPSLLLPQLERLVLIYVPIVPTSPYLMEREYPNQMRTWLRIRATRGLKVPTLEFRSVFNLSESNIEEFRDCAEEIIWDGTTNESPYPRNYFESPGDDDITPDIFLGGVRYIHNPPDVVGNVL
ncbi:hypothetical protein NLI96_g7654 [Meripilus lineatus]|uniref:F-box domain-containing protein n=1 Tax=Meripilus lineatus TaxID=2056292 RepID=A0AAD5YGZ4_9APHY|nr:hypothetical protein NLI96_g7654 [Physisporinus lineatus]